MVTSLLLAGFIKNVKQERRVLLAHFDQELLHAFHGQIAHSLLKYSFEYVSVVCNDKLVLLRKRVTIGRTVVSISRASIKNVRTVKLFLVEIAV